MKIKILIMLLIYFVLASCSNKVEKKVDISKLDSTLLECCPDGGGLLPSPINLGRKSDVVYNDLAYILYEVKTSDKEEYKDHSPFVEIDRDNPLNETLWFTTSRMYDNLEIPTNLPQHLYYSTRNVDKNTGSCPNIGWSEPNRFKINGLPLDELVIGAVSIAGDTMLLGATHAEGTNAHKYNYFNDLYVLVRDGSSFKFIYPIDLQKNVIDSLCRPDTWESQPTLSKCGNHLFFVSNRPLEGETAPSDMNIFYSKKVNGIWTSPILFPFNSDKNEETPQISADGRYLYFATDNPDYAKIGGYDIVAVEFESIIEGGVVKHKIGNSFNGKPVLAEQIMSADCVGEKKIKINDGTNQRYPHLYDNPANKLSGGKAIFWSSDNPKGYGGYDIYGCAIPKKEIKLEVVVLNALNKQRVKLSHSPFVELYEVADGQLNKIKSDNSKDVFKFDLDFDKTYAVMGGTNGNLEDCNFCPDSILKGYVFPEINSKNLDRDSIVIVKTEVREIPLKSDKISDIPKVGEVYTVNSKRIEKDIFGEPIEYDVIETAIIKTEPKIINGNKVKAEVEVKEVSYRTPTYVYTLTLNEAKKIDPLVYFNGFTGPKNSSEKTKNQGINTKNITECKILDTIYVIPHCEEMPPCKFKFAEYWGAYQKRVPYFQTAYWKVNTNKNFLTWNNRSKISSHYPDFMKPIDAQIPDAAVPPEGWEHWAGGAKWVELHPENSYWSSPEDSLATERVRRIKEYAGYSIQVDKNLKNASSVLCDKLLPAYQIIYGVQAGGAPSKAKFMIYVEAWSDFRNVKRGWYLSDTVTENTITYASGSIEENVTDPGFRLVKVKHGDALGKNNDVLSDLRAYFGYNELLNVLKIDSLFKLYFNADEVLTPDMLVKDGKLIEESEIQQLIEKSKIIILAKGYSTLGDNEGFIPQINAYNRIKTQTDYKDLDTVRTLNIVAEPLYYLAGEFKKSDCCRPDKLEIEDHDMNEKLAPYRVSTETKQTNFVVSLGVYNSQIDAQTIKSYVDIETGLTGTIDELKYHDGSKKFRIYFGPYEQAEAIQKQAMIKPLLIKSSSSPAQIPVTVEKYDLFETRLNKDIGAGLIVLKTSNSVDYTFVSDMEAKINQEIRNKYESIPEKSISERRKFYDNYLVGPTRVNIFKSKTASNSYEYIYYIGPFETQQHGTYFIEEFVKKHISSAKYATDLNQ